MCIVIVCIREEKCLKIWQARNQNIELPRKHQMNVPQYSKNAFVLSFSLIHTQKK